MSCWLVRGALQAVRGAWKATLYGVCCKQWPKGAFVSHDMYCPNLEVCTEIESWHNRLDSCTHSRETPESVSAPRNTGTPPALAIPYFFLFGPSFVLIYFSNAPTLVFRVLRFLLTMHPRRCCVATVSVSTGTFRLPPHERCFRKPSMTSRKFRDGERCLHPSELFCVPRLPLVCVLLALALD